MKNGWTLWMIIAASVAALAGCGGSDDATPAPVAPSEASATIGAAGGTLDGPDGTQVVIPPQALTQDTLIRIARSSAGAPAGEPQGYSPQGPMYEFTPHDIVFERPVTLRMPVPAAAGASSPAEAFSASPTSPWHPVEATVADGFAQWQSTSFSWFQPWFCAPRVGDPHPCVWVRLITRVETATSGALTLTDTDPLRSRTYRLSESATVRLTWQYQAARDCSDARLTVTRYNRRNSVITRQVLVDNLQVGLTDKPGSSNVSEGSHVFDVAFTDADNGTVSFGSRVSCQRAFQPSAPPDHRQSDVDALVIVVAAAPPVTAAPVITQQPADLTVNVGASAAFTVAATAPDSLSLDWQRSNDAGVTWSSLAFSGTVYSFVAAAVDSAARFRAQVCNVKGNLPANCIFSQGAVLTVTAVPATGTAVGKLSTLWQHTCAVMADATLACWGDNGRGQLGDGNEGDSSSPVEVSGGLSGVTAVSAGVDSTCAIHGGGSVACWGRLAFSTVPFPVSLGASAAVSVATGRDHACAVDAAGAVWCWGDNGAGELGDGSTSSRASAQVVRLADNSALSGAVAVVAGSDFSCAQLIGGEVYCWGSDILFRARTAPERIVKQLPDGSATSFTVTGRISAGLNHVCGVESGGFEPYCWGFNNDGQLGDNTTNGRNGAMSANMFGLVSVAAGPSTSCGIRSADLICWGRAAMGNGSGPQTLLYPQAAGRPATLSNVADPVVLAAAGRDHVCVLRSNGNIMCWGSNDNGQLGIGTTSLSWVPTSTTAGAAFWR